MAGRLSHQSSIQSTTQSISNTLQSHNRRVQFDFDFFFFFPSSSVGRPVLILFCSFSSLASYPGFAWSYRTSCKQCQFACVCVGWQSLPGALWKSSYLGDDQTHRREGDDVCSNPDLCLSETSCERLNICAPLLLLLLICLPLLTALIICSADDEGAKEGEAACAGAVRQAVAASPPPPALRCVRTSRCGLNSLSVGNNINSAPQSHLIIAHCSSAHTFTLLGVVSAAVAASRTVWLVFSVTVLSCAFCLLDCSM